MARALAVRFGSTDVGTVRVLGPFGGAHFTTYLSNKSRAEVERMFTRPTVKIIWQ
jgi:hypothetical protein